MNAKTSSPGFMKRYISNDGKMTFANYLLAIVYALLIIVPVYYVLISSFKSNSEIYNSPIGLPQQWSLEKFQVAQERVNLFRAIGVSFFVTIGAEAINLALGFLAAFGIARIHTKMAKVVEMIFSAGFLIPTFAILVPVYLLAVKTHLLNNPLSLVFFLSASRLPITIIMLVTFMREIPREMEESAEIDGASRLQIIGYIFFPMTSSGIITILIINFLSFWNEYLFGWILLAGDAASRTVQMVVPLLRTDKNVDYGLIAAAVTMSLIPVMIIFILFQEKIISGISAGAVKG